jgi:hypothetical protein
VAALGHAASVRSTLRVTSRWRAHPGMVDYLQTIVMPRMSAYPEGLFWTVPLQSGREDGGHGGVSVDLDDGKARMRAKNLRVMDFFNIPNALFRFQNPASVRATVSFDIRWLGPATGRSAVTSPPGSSGQLLMSPATMKWSAENAQGFSFKSDPSSTTSVFGQLGRVRNGIFSH